VPLPVSADAPAFTLPDGDGALRGLADLTSGGAVLLVFFKTTCPTCSLAMPVVAELQRRYGDAVPVVGVTQSTMATTLPWLRDAGFAGPVLDDEQDRFAASRAYQVDTVPTLVLVQDGRVVAASEGWDRDRMNTLAADLGARTGRDVSPVSVEGDGRPVFKPG
jgi:thiol-disulfide isomerase/thioredoxin